MDIGYDPVIAINRHIALLSVRDELVTEMAKHKGFTQAAVRGIGQMVVEELRQSKAHMRANQTWVDERPLADGRYRYGFRGRSSAQGLAPDDLEQHKRMVMGDISCKLETQEKALNK